MASERNSKKLLQRKQLSQQGSRAPWIAQTAPSPDKERGTIFRASASPVSLAVCSVTPSIYTLSNKRFAVPKATAEWKEQNWWQPVPANTGAVFLSGKPAVTSKQQLSEGIIAKGWWREMSWASGNNDPSMNEEWEQWMLCLVWLQPALSYFKSKRNFK